MSTESIASPSTQAPQPTERCASCGSPMAADQRYCLQCGERRVALSAFLRAGTPRTPGDSPPPAASVPPKAVSPSSGEEPQRNATLTVIAGVGVLLLAMGVGVLIGRAEVSKPTPVPAQVITVATGAAGASSAAGSEEAFTDDWPSATNGYTVQLQTLPQGGSTVKSVEAAKTAAGAKGAASVGALKSEDFTSLSSGSYIIYSGVYSKRAEAEKALGGLKKKFPGAKVIAVSNKEASASEGGKTKSGNGAGSSVTNPAPPSVLESLKSTKGKSYEEKSKALPDVVSTG